MHLLLSDQFKQAVRSYRREPQGALAVCVGLNVGRSSAFAHDRLSIGRGNRKRPIRAAFSTTCDGAPFACSSAGVTAHTRP